LLLSPSTLLQFGCVGNQGHRLTVTIDQNYDIAQPCLDLNQIPGVAAGVGSSRWPPTVHLPQAAAVSRTSEPEPPISGLVLRGSLCPAAQQSIGGFTIVT
jgi:hypothetical protein